MFATSPTETLRGAPKTFVTAASAPVLVGETFQGPTLTPYAVTLEAQVNPENQPSISCVFEYGKAAVSEHKAACAPPAVEGSGVTVVTASLTGLEPVASYHYRVVVVNKAGEVEGKEEAFKTLADSERRRTVRRRREQFA